MGLLEWANRKRTQLGEWIAARQRYLIAVVTMYLVFVGGVALRAWLADICYDPHLNPDRRGPVETVWAVCFLAAPFVLNWALGKNPIPETPLHELRQKAVTKFPRMRTMIGVVSLVIGALVGLKQVAVMPASALGVYALCVVGLFWLYVFGIESKSSTRAFYSDLIFHLRELPSFSYREVTTDRASARPRVVSVPYRSYIQWLIMFTGEMIALLTVAGVAAVFLQFFYPGLAPIASFASALSGGYKETDPLLLTLARLANLGILVLSANAVLEIGLLIEEPGVKHVRRVLALSFTGMGLYLVKEYPINHDPGEFLLGLLSGVIAALLWLMKSVADKVEMETESVALGVRQFRLNAEVTVPNPPPKAD